MHLLRFSVLASSCALLAAVGCVRPPTPTSDAKSMAVGCTGATDSARAARVASDSLARRDAFARVVERVSLDSGSFRVLSRPGDSTGVLDGLVSVRVGPGCRILSVTPGW
jgi:hypothetical protein